MLSALGRSHTFDRRADGYCRGEGCGVFLLDATVGKFRVRGSAVQQDGPSASLTAPNGSSQKRLIKSVQEGSEVSYRLEAHGTGTALGDPIEVVVFFHGPSHRIFSRSGPLLEHCVCRRGEMKSARPWRNARL